MDMESLEAWYDEQKSLLTEKYDARYKKNPEKAKKHYQASLKRLHRQYESRSKRQIRKNLKSHFLKHRLRMIKEKLLSPFKKLKERLRP